jgi:hypothetical protein
VKSNANICKTVKDYARSGNLLQLAEIRNHAGALCGGAGGKYDRIRAIYEQDTADVNWR